MNKTSKILMFLIFLVLVANFFQPLFFPEIVRADEPYQVAVLKGQLKASMMRVEAKIKKLEQKVDNHTHKIEICECGPDVSKVEIETSKAK